MKTQIQNLNLIELGAHISREGRGNSIQFYVSGNFFFFGYSISMCLFLVLNRNFVNIQTNILRY